MDIFNVLKITTAIITVVFAVIAGAIELWKNPKYWLNRFFALFFVSMALGFFMYSLYHLILNNALIVIPMMVSAQILYNFAVTIILMTVFILDKGEKIAMTRKYLGITFLIFVITIFGYFIWVPTLNMERYDDGIVDTETPLGWYIFVTIARLVLFGYVLFRYYKISKLTEGTSKIRVIWFLRGSSVALVGIILNMLGGVLSSLPLEIIGLIFIDIGIIGIVKGLLTEEKVESV